MFCSSSVCCKAAAEFKICISLLTTLTPPFLFCPPSSVFSSSVASFSPSLMSSNTHLVITSCPSSLLYIILPFPLFHTPFFTSIPHLKHKNTSPTYPHCALLLLLLSVHVRPSCLTSIQSPPCWPAPRPSLLTICFFLRPVTFSLPSSSSQNLMPIPLSR